MKSIDPIYPDLAREAGIEGRVYVHMLVGKDGRVIKRYAPQDTPKSLAQDIEAALAA